MPCFAVVFDASSKDIEAGRRNRFFPDGHQCNNWWPFAFRLRERGQGFQHSVGSTWRNRAIGFLASCKRNRCWHKELFHFTTGAETMASRKFGLLVVALLACAALPALAQGGRGGGGAGGAGGAAGGSSGAGGAGGGRSGVSNGTATSSGTFSSPVATPRSQTFANPLGQGVRPATSTTGSNPSPAARSSGPTSGNSAGGGVGTAPNGLPIGSPGSGKGSPENPW
jgi:hypothetical protein